MTRFDFCWFFHSSISHPQAQPSADSPTRRIPVELYLCAVHQLLLLSELSLFQYETLLDRDVCLDICIALMIDVSHHLHFLIFSLFHLCPSIRLLFFCSFVPFLIRISVLQLEGVVHADPRPSYFMMLLMNSKGMSFKFESKSWCPQHPSNKSKIRLPMWHLIQQSGIV